MNYQDKTVGSVQLPENSPAWLIHLAGAVQHCDREEFIATITAFTESVQNRWRSSAIQEARGLVEQFNLTPKDVFARSGVRAGHRSNVAAKYRDPETGKTWSGRGKVPKWLEGKNKSDYAI